MTSDLTLAADAGFIARVADPGAFIARACEQGKARLRAALELGEIDQVAEVKAEAAALAATVHEARERLGGDVLLAVAELLRRAERATGISIRRGQEDGTIRGPHDGKLLRRPGSARLLRSAREFASQHELSGGKSGQPGIYTLSDDIADDDFEVALKEARAERNLSRANVARKAVARTAGAPLLAEDWIPEPGNNHAPARAQRRRLIAKWAAEGRTSRQMAVLLGMRGDGVRRIAREDGTAIPADEGVVGSRHIDSTRIVRETAHALEGLAMGTDLVTLGDLDPAEAKDWAASLAESLRTLNRFARQIKEIAQ